MRILFIYPSSLNEQHQPIKYARAFLPPLSLPFLDGLTPRHHTTRIVNDLVEDIDFSGEYDLVALTAMTTQAARAYQIADRFRSRGVPVIMGGIHASALPEEAKQHADAVIVGEADTLWESILEDGERGALKDLYRASSLSDLQELVLPRWGNMNLNIYPKQPFMPIFTTRGCPYGCSFCSVTKFFGTHYRTRPISHVLQEIDATGSRQFFFIDDNIACNPDYSRELFTQLARRNTPISWFGQISTTVLKHPDLIDLAAKAGCATLFIGMESFQPTALRSVKKGFNNSERYTDLIARMYRAGIAPFPSFIFGFDEDTPEQFRLTLNFLRKHRVSLASFCMLTPLPGTDLFDEMKRTGRLEHEDWSRYDLSHVVFQPKHFTKEQFEELYWKTYQKFYSIPHLLHDAIGGGLLALARGKNPLPVVSGVLYYQSQYRRKVYAREFPLSGGLGRMI